MKKFGRELIRNESTVFSPVSETGVEGIDERFPGIAGQQAAVDFLVLCHVRALPGWSLVVDIVYLDLVPLVLGAAVTEAEPYDERDGVDEVDEAGDDGDAEEEGTGSHQAL